MILRFALNLFGCIAMTFLAIGHWAGWVELQWWFVGLLVTLQALRLLMATVVDFVEWMES